MRKTNISLITFDTSVFAENLRKMRELRGYTQEKLANLLHVQQSKITKLEKGHQQPSIVDLNNICEALDCDMLHLFGKTATAKSEYEFIGKYLGLSEEACRALGYLKDNPVVSVLIESLLTEIAENEYTGKKEVVPSSILLDLSELCREDYGPPNLGSDFRVNDVYSGEYHETLLMKDIFKIKEQRLYDNLRHYIKEQREKKQLTIYDEI